jgi:probable pyridine nucleotide-disulfide oxidoreductase
MIETEARAHGHRVKVARLPPAAFPRAKTLHETVATWKAVVDAKTDQILGARLLSHDAGDVISAVEMGDARRLRYQRCAPR